MTRSLRYLWMLLTLLLALPAMQANACAPEALDAGGHAMHAQTMQISVAMADHGHHGDAPEAPSPAKTHHDCIGCAAPIDTKAYHPAQAMMITTRDHARMALASLTGQNRSPEPRPPRLSV